MPVSAQRISTFSYDGGDSGGVFVSLVLLGSSGEVVTMTFASPDGTTYAGTCTVGRSGRVAMTVEATAPSLSSDDQNSIDVGPITRCAEA